MFFNTHKKKQDFQLFRKQKITNQGTQTQKKGETL